MENETVKDLRDIVFKINNCSDCLWKDKCNQNNCCRNGRIISCENFYPCDTCKYLNNIKEVVENIEQHLLKCNYEMYSENNNVLRNISEFNEGNIVFFEDINNLFDLIGYIPNLNSYIDYDDNAEAVYISR